MRVAGDFDDACLRRQRVGQVQAVVAAERIGVQVSLVAGQELLRAITSAVKREVEHVVRMSGIAQVRPHPRRAEQMRLRVL